VKSFSILRTNVGLTTNVKVVVDSNYGLYLDSIESHSELSNSRYKKMRFISKNYYDELVPYFFKKTPIDIAYNIKYDDDSYLMDIDFSKQYDEIYQYGAKNIVSNKNYTEEFEYFAPLYLSRSNIPSHFIVFRVDGAGVDLLTKENIITDVINDFKFVKLWSLGQETNLGQWLDINFKRNESFPDSPLEIDFRELEFCKWNGIDYETGGYCSKSLFIDDILDEEKEIFEMEKFIFNNYKNNKVIFPNILNFSFLFDDEPSNPDIKRKWSINRYYGFYLDKMEKVQSISPYITPFLRSDVVVLEGNILNSSSNEDPFVEGWSDNRPFYVEYQGEYFIVKRFTETLKNQLLTLPSQVEEVRTRSSVGLMSDRKPAPTERFVVPKTLKEQYVDVEISKYRIISEKDFTGMQSSDFNKNYGVINSTNELISYDSNYLQINDFDKYSVWIIEINGIYHNLFKEGEVIKINTDYSFTFNQNDYSYKVSGIETKVNFKVDFLNPPKKFDIYRLSFTDIKDFDTRIVDTEYSKYEYEKEDEITYTDEPKMYMENPLTETNPKDLDDFIYQGEVVNIPVSSEYTANYETFKLVKGELSDIWRKNSVYCRWSFQNSISGNDYPYSLNNSFLFEDYNRTTNPFEDRPIRSERNLDYFYTINSSTSSYVFHSLHVEGYKDDFSLDTNFKFELDKYLNLATYSIGTSSVVATYSLDYFTDFFYRRQYFNDGKIVKNVKKYSHFNSGDSSTPNISLFKGLKFLIYDVDSIDMSKEGEIENINLSTSNKYDDYKLSILLSDNDLSVDFNGNLIQSDNSMQWKIIKEWQMDFKYKAGDVVNYGDILYEAIADNITTNPIKEVVGFKLKSTPYNQTNIWSPISITGSIFFNPNLVYQPDDVIFYYDDYYQYDPTGQDDLWNPVIAISNGYSNGDKVFFKEKWYISTTNNNRYPPDNRVPYFQYNPLSGGNPFNATIGRNWVISKTQSSSPMWKPVELWIPNKPYVDQKVVAHKDVIFKNLTGVSIEAGEEPGVSGLWTQLYSFEPDTNYVYPGTNPVIKMNNNYYLCTSNSNRSTLDNGVNIYVNKKWKNILININISDNTFPNISNTNRDDLYTDLYEKLTAFNFIRAINDLTIKYGFTDYVNYIVINEDGKITKHNYQSPVTTDGILNFKKLPCLIKIDEPEELKVKVFSLTKTVLPNPKSLNSNRRLSDGKIISLNQINWYSDLPYSMEIEENKFEPKSLPIYHGGKNIINDSIWRHSGYYMPTFYDIELFDKQLDGISDNTRFDISLTDFGLMKERKLQKINRKGSLLKLRNEQSQKSVYPMLDEYGYSFIDFFIFSSTWDFSYHYETIGISTKPKFDIKIPTLKSEVLKEFGQPQSVKIENKKNFNL
jgi:hypothetical protein